MKKYILVLAMGLLTSSAFATEITQDPGSTIRVRAGDDVTVTCSGSSSGNISQKDCTITGPGTKDKYGTFCNNMADSCANYYSYGTKMYSKSSSDVTELANWCDRKLQQ